MVVTTSAIRLIDSSSEDALFFLEYLSWYAAICLSYLSTGKILKYSKMLLDKGGELDYLVYDRTYLSL